MTDKKQSTSDGSRSGSRYDGSRIDSSRYDGSRYDGSRYDGTRFDGTRFEERSTMTEVLIQTLTGGRLRPALSNTPAGRRARFGRIAAALATVAALAAVGFAVVPRLFEPPLMICPLHSVPNMGKPIRFANRSRGSNREQQPQTQKHSRRSPMNCRRSPRRR